MQEAPYLFIFTFDCTRSSLLCVGFSLGGVSGGYSLVAMHRLLFTVASLAAEQKL